MARASGRGWRARGRVDGRGILALAVCIAISSAMIWLAPSRDASDQEVRRVALDGQGEIRGYRAGVDAVTLTRVVTKQYGEDAVAHPGTAFVVVDWWLAAERERVALSTIELRTGDYRYRERVDLGTASYAVTQPGFTSYSRTVFEVPEDRLAGSLMVLGPTPSGLVSYTLVLGFDLGLTADARRVPAVPLGERRVEVSR